MVWDGDVRTAVDPVDEDEQQEQLIAFVESLEAGASPPGTPVKVMEPADQYPIVRFKIGGAAAPQGSKHGFAIRSKAGFTGKVAMKESSKRNPQWRADVAAAATAAMGTHELLPSVLRLTVVFVFPRPKSHYTSRGALTKSAAAIPAPTQHNIGDTSKLVRSIEDAMNKIVYLDDSQITTIQAKKRWGIAAATYITVEPDPVEP